MVVARKEKPSFIAKNLKFLRKNVGKTLEEMAEFLALKGKSSYNAYEEERALPDIHKLMKLATFFDISLEDLAYNMYILKFKKFPKDIMKPRIIILLL